MNNQNFQIGDTVYAIVVDNGLPDVVPTIINGTDDATPHKQYRCYGGHWKLTDTWRSASSLFKTLEEAVNTAIKETADQIKFIENHRVMLARKLLVK